MENAKAKLFGGKLVNAEDCNYESYKDLLLCCPACDEPVFLKTGLHTKPHFAHFFQKGIKNSFCPLRVSSQNNCSDYQALDRGQKLEIFKKYLLSIVLSGSGSSLVGYSYLHLSKESASVDSSLKNDVEKSLQPYPTLFNFYLSLYDTCNNWLRTHPFYLSTTVTSYCYEKLETEDNIKIERIQKDITREVVIYYFETNAGKDQGLQLLSKTIYELILDRKYSPIKLTMHHVFRRFIFNIISIDWVSLFNEAYIRMKRDRANAKRKANREAKRNAIKHKLTQWAILNQEDVGMS